ncbi:protein kinase domain-containing protein [Azospirillum sp. sgz302134]
MSGGLAVSIGQHSDQGRKATNQDFHGALLPEGRALASKGVVIALADGISTSALSRVAAETAVKSLLTDYYCTSEAWSVKTSAQRVINAANSWLYAETRRSRLSHDMDRGYVCTLSAMVLKSRSAHLFHIGDSRIYRVAGETLEPLTNDHRIVLSSQESYLGRAVGAAPNVEIDYRVLELSPGDVFVLATDGVYEHVAPRFVAQAIAASPDDLDVAAQRIVEEALDQGSPDNLTIQIARIDALPDGDAGDVFVRTDELAPPPLPDAPCDFDGYRILRQIHANSRSHIYLAADPESGARVAIKIPSVDLRGDEAYLRRFMMEEWIARRLRSAHVLKAVPPNRRRNFLYVVTDHVEGQTLRQWMIDNPRPDFGAVLAIVEQIEKGLRAFHRMEMVHQDLRPENIMIDRDGGVTIIDFGSTKVAGVHEAAPDLDGEAILGTVQYAAPEYFVGEPGTPLSDQFSLGVIAYEMLTGRLPYGAEVGRARSRKAQRRLRYIPARSASRPVPEWVDAALCRAVHPDPLERYEALSEFIADLRRPNPEFAPERRRPLMERNPLLFWKGLSAVLAAIVLVLLSRL